MRKNLGSSEEANKRAGEMKRRIVISLVFAVSLLFLSMGSLVSKPTSYIVEALLVIPIIAVNHSCFKDGFSQLIHKKPTANSLIAIGTIAALLITSFETAGMILTLKTLGDYLEIRAKAKAEDFGLLSEEDASQVSSSGFAERAASAFIPMVIGIAVVVFLIWLVAGAELSQAAMIAISVLVAACPRAFELAESMAIVVGSGKGAHEGILIKSADAWKQTPKVDTVVLDKTGTITVGIPRVTDVIAFDDDFSLLLAAGIEKYSTHPLAKAILTEALEKPGVIPEPVTSEEIPGRGVVATIGKRVYAAGNEAFMEAKGIEPAIEEGHELSAQGKTVVYFAEMESASSEGDLIGIVALRDGPKPTSLRAVTMLENMGIDVIMLTGDNYATASAIKKEVGIDHAIAQVLPQDKYKVIENLQDERQKIVAMVGDWDTEAPAITQADVGIAIGEEKDIDDGQPDVVLLHDDLAYVARVIRLSRAVMSNIKQSLFGAVSYNVVAVLIAAGALFPLTGWLLHPIIGAAFMSLGPVCVVRNALRMRKLRLYQK